MNEKDILTAFVLKKEPREIIALRLSGRLVMTEDEKNKLSELIEKFESGTPIQYLTGDAYFYGRRFLTDENVLIPRQDTEISVEEALKRIKKGDKILDLCTGSGCIGLTLVAETDAEATLADISPYALSLAKKNAELLGVKDKVKIIKHDIFSDIPEGKYGIITSNPPYIKSEDLPFLPDVVKSEPRLALDGGDDGLCFYRVIAKRYREYIEDGGYLIVECGAGQDRDIENIFSENGFSEIKSVPDYAGINRVVIGRKF